MDDDESDTITTISGSDIIMAYGEHVKFTQPDTEKRVCTRLFWTQYLLFMLNIFVLAASLTLIGLGAWAQLSEPGMELFETLITVPSWLMIGGGIAMVLMGLFGCIGAVRLNLCCLRTFTVLLVAVFVLQVATGAVLFFIMDDVNFRMLTIVRSAITNYRLDDDNGRDKALDYLQREFSCCGASSYSDWDMNRRYNCSNVRSVSNCGVPSSCCRGAHDEQCGHGVRYGTKDYSDMFTYTAGCVDTLMVIFQENYVVLAVVALSVCLLEICCLALSSIVSNHIVRQRKLKS